MPLFGNNVNVYTTIHHKLFSLFNSVFNSQQQFKQESTLKTETIKLFYSHVNVLPKNGIYISCNFRIEVRNEESHRLYYAWNMTEIGGGEDDTIPFLQQINAIKWYKSVYAAAWNKVQCSFRRKTIFSSQLHGEILCLRNWNYILWRVRVVQFTRELQ